MIETAVDDLAAWLTGIWDGLEDKAFWLHDLGCDSNLTEPFPCTCGVPAAVEAMIAANRQILLTHGVAWTDDVCTICHSYPDGVTPERAQWPCRTLRLLALPHADRPGYREEWKP